MVRKISKESKNLDCMVAACKNRFMFYYESDSYFYFWNGIQSLPKTLFDSSDNLPEVVKGKAC